MVTVEQLAKVTTLLKDSHEHYREVINHEDLLLHGERMETARIIAELVLHV